jgi:hypothetical protein
MNGDNLATSANSSVRSFSGLTGGDTVDFPVFGDWICSGDPGLLVLERVDRCVAGITIKSTFLAQQVVEFLMLIVVSSFRLPYRKRLTVTVHATYTVDYILCRSNEVLERKAAI